MRTAELELGGEADAPARARSFLRSALEQVDPDLVADAASVVTELVTNAQLHGAAPVVVRASFDGPLVRLEVQDAGRHLPVLPVGSAEAMTGRGLVLVAGLSSAWGVRPSAEGPGKVLWAELGGPVGVVGGAEAPGADAHVDADALLGAWPDDAPAEATFTVRLGSVPTDLLLDAKRHVDNVVRELTLERAGRDVGALVPGVRALVETISTDFADARAAIKRQAAGGGRSR
jgi:anti-sigma regulatory factor (Ser/Thr protein kinase)